MAGPRRDMKVLVGAGAFGMTYHVRTRDGREFAQKEVELSRCTERQRSRLLQEVEILSQLRNVGIIEYIGHYQCDGILCIMMQWADGGDMQNFLRKSRGTRLPEDQVMHLFIQMCLAVHYLHENHVLHRDLKPANILLMKDGLVKLADFGCARHLNARELARSLVGTCPYMAPELLERRRRYDSKVDIWSLGCILYELYTFRTAFIGGVEQIRSLHKRHQLPNCDTIAHEAQELIHRMLAFDPADRLSARQVLMTPFIRRYLIRFLEAARPAPPAPDPDPAPPAPDPPPAGKPNGGSSLRRRQNAAASPRDKFPGDSVRRPQPGRPGHAPIRQNADWRPAPAPPRKPNARPAVQHRENDRHPRPRNPKLAAAPSNAKRSPREEYRHPPPRKPTAHPAVQQQPREDNRHPPPPNRKPAAGSPDAAPPPREEHRHPPPRNRKPSPAAANRAPLPREDYRHPPPRNRKPSPAAANRAPLSREDYRHPPPPMRPAGVVPASPDDSPHPPAPDTCAPQAANPIPRVQPPGRPAREPLRPIAEQLRRRLPRPPPPAAEQPRPPPVIEGVVARGVSDDLLESVEPQEIPIDLNPGLLEGMQALSTAGNLILDLRAAIGWGELDPTAEPEQGVAAEEVEADEGEQ